MVTWLEWVNRSQQFLLSMYEYLNVNDVCHFSRWKDLGLKW